MHQSWVYIMANRWNSTLYVGVTSDLQARVADHQAMKDPKAFTARYNCVKLVWYEEHSDVATAIVREKQLKNWKRDWKDALVVKENPNWLDLSDGWFK